MSLERDGRDDGPQLVPEPVVTVPDDLEILDQSIPHLTAAAGSISLSRLVVRRVRWSWAGAVARLASWLGDRAALAVRHEAAARHAVAVARYERKLYDARVTAHKWKMIAEAKEVECEALTKLHVRITARIQADTTAHRLIEKNMAQQGQL